MDKETLSNYGWIVICVLVLAVMIALATPFGSFIADGFKATYAGFGMVGDNALNSGLTSVGIVNNPVITFDQELGTDSDNPSSATNASFTISGTVTDDDGIKSFKINNTEITVDADGKWSTTLTLEKNVVTEIIAVATDEKNNETTEKRYVSYIVYYSFTIDAENRTDVGYDENAANQNLKIPETFQKDGKWYKCILRRPTAAGAVTNGS